MEAELVKGIGIDAELECRVKRCTHFSQTGELTQTDAQTNGRYQVH